MTLIEWFRGRWELAKGNCPACLRKFYGKLALHNTECNVCRGHNDSLSIWSRFNKPRPKPVPKLTPLQEEMVKTICCGSREKDAVVDK